MTDSFISSTDQAATTTGTDNSQVSTTQTEGTQYSVAGKSFKDLDSMKNSYENQETHISTLESERAADRQRIADLEAKVSQASTLDEVLERIRSGNTGEGASFDLDQITSQVASQVESGLKAKEQEAKKADNWQQVCDRLTDTFGDKVDEQVLATAKKFGMTFDDAISMAKTKPSVFLNLFELKSADPSRATSGTINTLALPNVEREKPKTSVLNLRTDSERVANYASRLDELYKQRGIN